MKGNRTNHPSRAGVEIKKHKGGREKVTVWITDADKAKIDEYAKAQNISRSEAIAQMIAKL